MTYRVIAVSFDDRDLDNAAQTLEDALNQLAGEGLTVTQVLQQRVGYSLPDPDSLYRDFHYNESGVLIVAQST